MDYKIIVSRYNEDISWLNSIMDKCIIYNKGEKLNLFDKSKECPERIQVNEILLDNFGRESETYLNYIINNYDNLPDIIVFTQARISDHRGSNDINYLFKLVDEAKISNISKPTLIYNKTDGISSDYWDFDWNFKKGKYYLEDNYYKNHKILFYDFFIKYVRKEYPNPINIHTNGIFAVQKHLIVKRPIEYYKDIIKFVNHHINPAEGHFFERSWHYIFE